MKILSVTDTIVNHLRTQIITGNLQAGQRLNEVYLSNHLEISRAPLREAFRVLEEDQLVVGNPRKGCYVTHTSLEDVIEVYESRDMIESYSIDLLEEKRIRRIPAAEKALAVTRHLLMPGDGESSEEKLEYILSFAEFHTSIVKSSGNKQLAHFYRGINLHLTRYQYMYADRSNLPNNSQKDHEVIYSLITEGDYKKAKQFLKRHIKSFVCLLQTKMKEMTLSEGAVNNPIR